MGSAPPEVVATANEASWEAQVAALHSTALVVAAVIALALPLAVWRLAAGRTGVPAAR